MYKGFTLAEVLITLGVIGVVSAVTMPALIQNHQKQTTVNRLKKSYSELAQAFKMAEADIGEVKYWNLDAPSGEFAEKYLVPYLKNTEPVSTVKLNDKIQYKFLDGKSAKGMGWEAGKAIKLSNGTIVFIDGWSPGTNSRRSIYVDINGFQKPNVFGKDLFTFQIKNNSFFTVYSSDKSREYLTSEETHTCNKNSSEYAGISCAALIMQDGWM